MRIKYYLIPAMVLVAAISLTACGSNINQEQQNLVNTNDNITDQNEQKDESEDQYLTYTNLVDQATQQEVMNQLIAAGIQEETANEFIDWVNEYNNNVISAAALQAGYQSVNQSPVDYSKVYINEEYREDGTLMLGMNCRLTSYLLFQQLIEAKQELASYDPYLMFDVEAIEMEKRYETFNKEKFITIFEPVTVKADSTLEDHIDAIAAAWKSRGISIQDNGKVSLITMYLHDNYEDKRFVGHAGILLDTEDELLLIEKYGWNEPFQATKFESESDMVDYLLSRPDLIGDGSEEAVIVMKNDTVIG
jgi:hypothetical protein